MSFNQIRRIYVPNPFNGFSKLKRNLLDWASSFPLVAFYDNCNCEQDKYGQYEFLIGVSESEKYQDIDSFHDYPKWRMGYISYDYKNQLEPDLVNGFAPLIPVENTAFFSPDWVIGLKRNEKNIFIEGPKPEELLEILKQEGQNHPSNPIITKKGSISSNNSEEEYIRRVELIKKHILEGNVYELNLSQNFSGNMEIESPHLLFLELVKSSPVPFGSYIKFKDTHILCASPERFLQKKGDRLLTQPIKGTIARGSDSTLDAKAKEKLRESEKDQAENIMIVDLCRNDLNKSCVPKSVQVPHLFKIESYSNVHHMVSTIEGRLRPEVDGIGALKEVFPPGSMTGAPKYRSMELIEELEKRGRGIYAGSIGYFEGENYDFNVVIRSIVYDKTKGLTSWHVGGAITWDSISQMEFEESMVKGLAITNTIKRNS